MTASISSAVIGLFRFSAPSSFSLGRLYFSRNADTSFCSPFCFFFLWEIRHYKQYAVLTSFSPPRGKLEGQALPPIGDA